MNIKEEILSLNRNPQLPEWFDSQLDQLIDEQAITTDFEQLKNGIVSQLVDYRTRYQIDTAVIGMSGGIDSALTAALFKAAGWQVTGVLMPIHQKSEETQRGELACQSLGINMELCDLTQAYDDFVFSIRRNVDRDINDAPIRQGNIRARLRMITLYNLAARLGGLVGSTDNFSELAAGFWTLHGDVGDVAPIQNLTKSWEVPKLAQLLGVPNEIVTAVPTDGLGISNSDEDQFGFSYLEFDIALQRDLHFSNDMDPDSFKVMSAIRQRVKSTKFKRINPVNLINPLFPDRSVPQV